MTRHGSDGRDDDLLEGPVPAPEAASSASEGAHARAFGALIDQALDPKLGGRVPAAMTADDRALLEVATVIRAAAGGGGLEEGRRRAVVEQALRQGIGEAPVAVSPAARRPVAGQRRWAPWAVAAGSAAIAAAAIALLWLRPPARHGAAPTARVEAPTRWRSRPADALIGEIKRERAGDARARIDVIFADRLDGYRERRWSAAPRQPEGAPR
jgi:hypothetical protein